MIVFTFTNREKSRIYKIYDSSLRIVLLPCERALVFFLAILLAFVNTDVYHESVYKYERLFSLCIRLCMCEREYAADVVTLKDRIRNSVETIVVE